MGTVDKSTVGGNIDASFILLHDYPNNYTTNLIGGVNNLSTLTSLPGVGTTINIRGAYTQASGKILDTNVIIENEDGTTLYNLTSATYPAIKGDSGGIIYSYVSASNTRYTVGVHVGLKNSVTYYCKANNVLSALGLSRKKKKIMKINMLIFTLLFSCNCINNKIQPSKHEKAVMDSNILPVNTVEKSNCQEYCLKLTTTKFEKNYFLNNAILSYNIINNSNFTIVSGDDYLIEQKIQIMEKHKFRCFFQ